MSAILAPLRLQLHPEKTRIVRLTHGAEGFDFVGFHCHKVRSRRWRGRFYLQCWPSDRAMRQIRSKVRQATSRSRVGQSVAEVVSDLNRRLRGWGNFFRWGNSAKRFWDIDRYAYECLERFMRDKHGHRRYYGRRRFYAEYQRLGVYRLSGTRRGGFAHAGR